MPNLNRKGPRGEGAMSGRGLGICGRGESLDEAPDTRLPRGKQPGLGMGRRRRGRGGAEGRGFARSAGAGDADLSRRLDRLEEGLLRLERIVVREESD